MDMKELRDIRDREWAIHRRQLDAWRTWELIDADRRREAEHVRKLTQELEVAVVALSEARSALATRIAELAQAQERVRTVEVVLAQRREELRKGDSLGEGSVVNKWES